MTEKQFNTRIVHKHDTAENWAKAVNFIPKQGEMIVYDIDDNNSYERIKIGDGIRIISELPFVGSGKVNVTDIIDNLTTNVATKPLSAAQGVALKSMVDAKAAKSDLTGLATESYVQAQIQAAIADFITQAQMEAYVNEAILGGEW